MAKLQRLKRKQDKKLKRAHVGDSFELSESKDSKSVNKSKKATPKKKILKKRCVSFFGEDPKNQDILDLFSDTRNYKIPNSERRYRSLDSSRLGGIKRKSDSIL